MPECLTPVHIGSADPAVLQDLYGLAGRICMAVREAFGNIDVPRE